MTVSSAARRSNADRPHATKPSTTKPGATKPGTTDPSSGEKALYRIPEAMRLLSLSRSVVYNQIRAGRLRSVKEGNTRLIPADAIADYVALLKAEADADAEAGR